MKSAQRPSILPARPPQFPTEEASFGSELPGSTQIGRAWNSRGRIDAVDPHLPGAGTERILDPHTQLPPLHWRARQRSVEFVILRTIIASDDARTGAKKSQTHG